MRIFGSELEILESSRRKNGWCRLQRPTHLRSCQRGAEKVLSRYLGTCRHGWGEPLRHFDVKLESVRLIIRYCKIDESRSSAFFRLLVSECDAQRLASDRRRRQRNVSLECALCVGHNFAGEGRFSLRTEYGHLTVECFGRFQSGALQRTDQPSHVHGFSWSIKGSIGEKEGAGILGNRLRVPWWIIDLEIESGSRKYTGLFAQLEGISVIRPLNDQPFDFGRERHVGRARPVANSSTDLDPVFIEQKQLCRPQRRTRTQ